MRTTCALPTRALASLPNSRQQSLINSSQELFCPTQLRVPKGNPKPTHGTISLSPGAVNRTIEATAPPSNPRLKLPRPIVYLPALCCCTLTAAAAAAGTITENCPVQRHNPTRRETIDRWLVGRKGTERWSRLMHLRTSTFSSRRNTIPSCKNQRDV